MIALPQEELLVRPAGYDRVPETKLTRSLREPWQRGRPGWSQNGCWSLQAHATHAVTCSATTEFMTLTAGMVEV